MDINREDVDEILDRLEIFGAPKAETELIRTYLNKQEEVMKLMRGETPLFGRR